MKHKKKNKDEVAHIWLSKPEAGDYQAAGAYLALLFPAAKAQRLAQALKRAAVTQHPAKDLLRASQTQLLEKDNPDVAKELKKVRKGKKLSPVLLIRGDGANGITLTIADGHHRICASWHCNEDAPIHCCLAGLG